MEAFEQEGIVIPIRNVSNIEIFVKEQNSLLQATQNIGDASNAKLVQNSGESEQRSVILKKK